ncbi:MAG TPA: Fe-S cluster assembly ATPase SufC, partial [Microthrixaceae bacterium]|nr:Fe-S cluster assembly ATPase SufC [Microthrixaceae bacterium]
MSELVVTDLRAEVAGRPILTGVNLTVRSGEVHAIMGPNGSGKSTLSHVLMGRPGYTVTGGSVTLDGVDLIGLAPHERAQAGLFLGMQYPTEVPGVSIQSVLRESLVAAGGSGADLDADLRAEAARVGLDPALVGRSLNVDFSGGEKKRNETVQLALLRPKFAILDEIDSGLDVDALAQVSQRVEEATSEWGLGVIAVTHYNRL